MQQTSLCTTCGAEMLDGARFCRKCGRPSTRFAEESVTEGTTRILEKQEEKKVFGQEFYEQHGSLAQPTTRIPPQVNETSRNLTTAEPKRQNWILIGSLLFVGLALIAAALIFTLRGSTPTPTIVIKKGMPPAPPPAPPALPPSTGQVSTISPDLKYPGAETTMDIKDGKEGDTLQLRTSDSVDKVVNWYTEKL